MPALGDPSDALHIDMNRKVFLLDLQPQNSSSQTACNTNPCNRGSIRVAPSRIGASCQLFVAWHHLMCFLLGFRLFVALCSGAVSPDSKPSSLNPHSSPITCTRNFTCFTCRKLVWESVDGSSRKLLSRKLGGLVADVDGAAYLADARACVAAA